MADFPGLSDGPELEVACDSEYIAASAHNGSKVTQNSYIENAYHFARDVSKQNIVEHEACASQKRTLDRTT